MRRLLTICALALVASSASAQLPGLRKRGAPTQPVLQGIDALRADFLARSGSDTVYFGNKCRARRFRHRDTQAQAMWRVGIEVVVRIGPVTTAIRGTMRWRWERASRRAGIISSCSVFQRRGYCTTWGNERRYAAISDGAGWMKLSDATLIAWC
jgi:hypothetical protein